MQYCPSWQRVHLGQCMFLHRPLLESSLCWMTVDVVWVLSASVHWNLLEQMTIINYTYTITNIHIPFLIICIIHKSKMKIIITAITMTTTTTITTTRAITVHEVVISVEYTVVFNRSKLIHTC